LRQQFLAAVKRLAAMSGTGQDLADQVGLAPVVVQDGYSHDGNCIKKSM
jgi:hypothetical protein